ncbi:MAG: hypothetical protein AAGC95_02785 [Pseudomonadota bacterium]
MRNLSTAAFAAAGLRSVLALAASWMFLTVGAQAALIKLDGLFSAAAFSDGASTPSTAPFDPVSGSFSLIYDDTIINQVQTVSGFQFDANFGSFTLDETDIDVSFVINIFGNWTSTFQLKNGASTDVENFQLAVNEGPSRDTLSYFTNSNLYSAFNPTFQGASLILDIRENPHVSQVSAPGALGLLIAGFVMIGRIARPRLMRN